jgi:hypothetical protein
MNETIEKTIKMVTDAIAGYSFTDQAFILTEMSERLKDEAHDALCAEYGFNEEDL